MLKRIVLPVIVLLLLVQIIPAAQKKVIPIVNSGAALTNYPMRLFISSATVDYAKTKDDGADLRFTSDTSAAASAADIKYWIESWNEAGSSYVWIKVPSIPAGTSHVAMHYEDAGAAAVSNGDSVFDFFEDWSALDTTTKWWVDPEGTGGTIAIENGALKLTRPAGSRITMHMRSTLTGYKSLEIKQFLNASASNYYLHSMFYGDTTAKVASLGFATYGDYECAIYSNDTSNGNTDIRVGPPRSGTVASDDGTEITVPTDSVWFNSTFKMGPDTLVYLHNHSIMTTSTEYGGGHNSGFYGFNCGSGIQLDAELLIDFIAFRAYAHPEPTAGDYSITVGNRPRSMVAHAVSPVFFVSPNPFPAGSFVDFAIPNSGDVSLKIYGMDGRLIRTLVSGTLAGGRHTTSWHGTNDRGTHVSRGAYVLQLELDKQMLAAQKVILR